MFLRYVKVEKMEMKTGLYRGEIGVRKRKGKLEKGERGLK